MWRSYLPLSTFSSLWLLPWCTMVSRILVYSLLALAVAVASVDGNSEVDALHAWKTTLADPYNVLQSWDPTLVNPCTWDHITCNSDNSVVRVDLGNAGLSGNLIPQLGTLANLQYLEVFRNKLSGAIPEAIGNLTNLISLDLYENRFSGPIPSSLGNLISLRFLRLNSNQISGRIPVEVLQLVTRGNLIVFNVSDNQLIGRVHFTRKTGFAVTEIIQDPRAQK